MKSEVLHVVTCVANPIGWQSRIRLARQAIESWLQEYNVHVTLVECAYGSRQFDLADLAGPRVNHIGVRATTLCWSKESLLNHGLRTLPSDARKVLLNDADIIWRKPGWAGEILKGLDIYPVLQPWTSCIDLGPNGEIIQVFTSFCHILRQGKPVIGISNPMLSRIGIAEEEDEGHHHHEPPVPPYHHHHHRPPHHHHHPRPHPRRNMVIEGINTYPHCGFSWAYQYEPLMKHIGGLLEVCGAGSADHHQALGLIGQAHNSVPKLVHPNYLHAVEVWSKRAQTHFNSKIGIVHQVIEHGFHGRKGNRAYKERWNFLIEHNFDPYTDLKKNEYGIYEFAGNKPLLERDFDLYLRNREEDASTLS